MFEGLSSELIIQILHCCEYPTILRFAATCKEYSDLVTHSTSLQLHIELEANGLELVKGSFKRDATYSVILDDLKGFHDSWMGLHFGQPVVRPVGKARMLLWKLQEGFFIKAFSQSQGHLADALQFIPLDSTTPDSPPLLFDFTFHEFTVDPGQGLVAIVSRNLGLFTTIQVDLCSIATGLAHSFAQRPRLIAEFKFERPFFTPKLTVEVIGNMVLTEISHPRLHTYEILIWDWKSGNLVNRIASRQGICDFTFLDRHHIVILSGTHSEPNRDDLCNLELLIYVLSDDGSYCRDTQSQLVTDLEVSQPILRLAFPQIQESSKISESGFYIGSDPIPGRSIYKNSADFACSHAVTLSMAFGFSRVNTGWEGDYYRAFLDGRFLLNQVRICSNKTMLVPWPSWGTRATRWFVTSRRPDHWIPWTSGSRFANRLSVRPYYCILDFSPPNTGRLRRRNSQSCLATVDRPDDARDLLLRNGLEDLRLLEQIIYRRSVDSGSELFVATLGADSPSIINGSGFEERVTSQLPYRVVCRMNNKLYHEGWQINGDCVVGVDSRGLASESLDIHKLEKMVVPRSNI